MLRREAGFSLRVKSVENRSVGELAPFIFGFVKHALAVCLVPIMVRNRGSQGGNRVPVENVSLNSMAFHDQIRINNLRNVVISGILQKSRVWQREAV